LHQDVVAPCAYPRSTSKFDRYATPNQHFWHDIAHRDGFQSFGLWLGFKELIRLGLGSLPQGPSIIVDAPQHDDGLPIRAITLALNKRVGLAWEGALGAPLCDSVIVITKAELHSVAMVESQGSLPWWIYCPLHKNFHRLSLSVSQILQRMHCLPMLMYL